MIKLIASFIKFRILNIFNNKKYLYFKNKNKYSKQIQADGYCILKNFLTSKECDLIKEEIKKYIKKNPQKIYIYKNYDFRIFSFNKVSPKANKYLKNKFLRKIVMQYESTNKIIYSFSLGAKLVAKRYNEGSGGGWHRDNLNSSYPKAILYLNDVRYNNGPFQYIRGSHKFLNILKFLINSKIGYDKKEFSPKVINKYLKKNSQQLKTFCYKKGSIIIFDSLGLHRGKPISNGIRYSLTNYYYPDNVGGKNFKHI